MATEAAHRPPITVHGLHARYANATYTAASKANILTKVEEELAAIKLTASKSPPFQAFLDNPLISRDDKEKGIQDMLGEGKVSNVTYNLLTTLAAELMVQASNIAKTMQHLGHDVATTSQILANTNKVLQPLANGGGKTMVTLTAGALKQLPNHSKLASCGSSVKSFVTATSEISNSSF